MPGAVELAEDLGHPLTSDEMRSALCGKAGLMTYSSAFPPDVDLRAELERWPARGLVFLYRATPTFGHWVATFERNGSLYVFDPYGTTPPDEWGKAIPEKMKERLGQEAPRLLEAVAAADYPAIYWNEYPLQYPDPSIQTCGRWAVARLAARELDVEDFASAIYTAARALGISTDELVCALVRI